MGSPSQPTLGEVNRRPRFAATSSARSGRHWPSCGGRSPRTRSNRDIRPARNFQAPGRPGLGQGGGLRAVGGRPLDGTGRTSSRRRHEFSGGYHIRRRRSGSELGLASPLTRPSEAGVRAPYPADELPSRQAGYGPAGAVSVVEERGWRRKDEEWERDLRSVPFRQGAKLGSEELECGLRLGLLLC